MNIEIANRLVNLRKSNHLSQEALAEKLGISRQAVSKWERAEASPDMDNLILLARLYHISLDELVRSDEEILAEENRNADVREAGSASESRNQKAEKVLENENWEEGSVSRNGEENIENVLKDEKQEAEGALGSGNQEIWGSECAGEGEDLEEDKEYVNIGLGGVHVKDKDGSEVHIAWDGIHVEDKKNEENVHIDKNGVFVNGEKYDNRNFWKHWNFPFGGLISISYVVIGALFNVWHPAWLLFLLIPLWYSFISAVRKRNANVFAYPVLVTLIFLCIGFFFGLWHPGWLLYLTIPLYYSFANKIIIDNISK